MLLSEELALSSIHDLTLQGMAGLAGDSSSSRTQTTSVKLNDNGVHDSDSEADGGKNGPRLEMQSAPHAGTKRQVPNCAFVAHGQVACYSC